MLSKLFSISLGILLVLLIGLVDFLTKDFFVLTFYIIPVALVTWFAGRGSGIFMALAAAITATILDVIESPVHSSFLVHYWNIFMSFGLFTITAYFLTFLKESLEVKSKFTSTISHEIRTPLSVIKEGVSIVMDGLCGNLTDEQKRILKSVNANADRLTILVNDILDFQKFESGKMKFIYEENNVGNVLREAYEGVSFLAKEKNLNVVFDIAEGLPKIKFDRGRITQVMTNLLTNAVKFTEKGTIVIGAAKTGNYIQVAVRDTGCGIAPEEMPRLFKTFEQLGKPEGRKAGSGLGLAISKEIVSRHGGKIWAESKPGEGTTFYFTLPIL